MFAPNEFPARDFVDGVGVASDVSISLRHFVPASIRYTRALLARARSDFHVIELADSLSHVSNVGLLRSRYFRQRLQTLVYAGIPTHEAVAHGLAYVRTLGYPTVPVLLSGPLANEERYHMARAEIGERLSLRICRSATQDNDRWIPEGSELARAIVDGCIGTQPEEMR